MSTHWVLYDFSQGWPLGNQLGELSSLGKIVFSWSWNPLMRLCLLKKKIQRNYIHEVSSTCCLNKTWTKTTSVDRNWHSAGLSPRQRTTAPLKRLSWRYVICLSDYKALLAKYLFCWYLSFLCFTKERCLGSDSILIQAHSWMMTNSQWNLAILESARRSVGGQAFGFYLWTCRCLVVSLICHLDSGS